MWKQIADRDANLLAAGFLSMALVGLLCAIVISAGLGGCAQPARAGWGPRGCGPVGSPVVYSQPIAYSQPVLTNEWRYDNWPETAELYQGGVYAGRYDYATGTFHPTSGGAYCPTGWPVFDTLVIAKAKAGKKKAEEVCNCSDKCPCTFDCPCSKTGVSCNISCKCVATAHLPDFPNNGVFSDRIPQKPGGTYRLGDWTGTKEITRAEAMADVGGKLSDDTGKYRIVIVGGTADQRNRVLDDLSDHASLSWLKENVLVQAYQDPNHYHLEGYKLYQDERFLKSSFMVALLAPPDKDGFSKRLYVRYDYDGGAERFGKESRKKVDDKFNPNQDKDGGGDIDVVGLLSKLPGWAYLAVGGVIAFLILLRKREVGHE